MKIINKINPRISAFKFKDEVRGFLINSLLKNEKILAFYPNCSLDEKGHSAVGWMEYKRSEDYGETWSQPYIFQPSLKLLHSEMKYSAMCEKAIVNEKGDIIVYQLICDISNDPQWQPYMVPSYSISRDKGSTWSNLRQIGTRRGRIYVQMYQEGTIFLLLFVNDATVDWTGQTTDHYYSLVVSEDGGENYYERSRIPIPSLHHGYGSMMFLEDGRLIVYNYNLDDEYNLSYVLSEDKGMSWGQAGTTFVAKKIRNPQVVGFEHLYFLHGRSGNNGEQAGNFVLYCSEDGIHWDEGRYLKVRTEGLGAYSNNLVIGKGTSHEKLLIQASHAYKDNQTNVLHWQIIKRKV